MWETVLNVILGAVVGFGIGSLFGYFGGFIRGSRLYNKLFRSVYGSGDRKSTYSDSWHPKYKATPAYHLHANQSLDYDRPLEGVWMCGVYGLSSVECDGFMPREEHPGCCVRRSLETGACLRAGRETSMKEMKGR